MAARGSNVATHWKPGQSGNPKGRPAAAMEADWLRRHQYVEFINKLCHYAKRSHAEVEAVLASKKTEMMDLICARLIKKAAMGDNGALQILLDRWFGKVKEVVEATIKTEAQLELEAYDRQSILDLLRPKAINTQSNASIDVTPQIETAEQPKAPESDSAFNKPPS